MKKKFKIYIFSLLVCLISVINVEAATKLTLSGGDNFVTNVPGTIAISIDSAFETETQVTFSVSFSCDTSYVALNISKDESVSGEAGLLSSMLNVGPTSNTVIANLTVTNLGIVTEPTDCTITLSEIKFADVPVSNVTKNIRLTAPVTTTKPLSNNSRLSLLSLSNGATLTPVFNPNTKNYKVHLKDTIKNLTVTHECDDCKVIIDCDPCTNFTNQNRLELEMGKNIVTIKTQSADKTTEFEYKLTIYRGETSDDSDYLESLTVNNFDFNEVFDKKMQDYTLSVPNEISSLDILAIPEDLAATYEIKGATDLLVGENVITITITSSETNKKRIYNITVTRLEEGEEPEPEVIPPTTTTETTPAKKSKWQIIAVIVLIGILIIGISALAIFGKKKGKKSKKQKPQIITDEGQIVPTAQTTDVSVQENELREDLNITEEKTKTSVDEALVDLMITKEIVLKKD